MAKMPLTDYTSSNMIPRDYHPQIADHNSNSHFQNIVVNSGAISETEGSVQKIQKGHFFTIRMLKRAPVI